MTLKLTTVAALLLLASAASAQDCFDAAGTSVVGQVSNGYCACASGYANDGALDCNLETVAPACLPFPVPSALETERPASLDDSTGGTYLAGDELHLRVRAPYTADRRVTSIDIQDSDNAPCMYPGANWLHALGDADCADHFDATIDWATATAAATQGGCGFELSADDDYFYYDAEISVEMTEVAGSVAGEAITRTLENNFRLQVQLQRQATVTYNNLEIFSPAGVDVEAAITAQRFDSPPIDQGTVVYRTAVPFPYRIDLDAAQAAIVSALPAGLSASLADASDPALCVADAECVQDFVLTIERADPTTCELDGEYVFDMPVVCRGDQSLCPLEGGETVQIVSSLDSEDVCATVVLTYDLEATIAAYEDAAHTTLKNAFIEDQTVFMRIDAIADAVSLESTTVTRVDYGGALDSVNSLQPLYADGAATAIASANGFALDTVAADAAGFHFDVSVGTDASDLFSVDVNDFAIFQLRVTVDVTYIDGQRRRRTETRTYTRRQALPAGAPAGSAQSVEEIVVSAIGATADNNAGPTSTPASAPAAPALPVALIAGVAGTVLVVGAAAGGAVLAARRRRSRSSGGDKKTAAATPGAAVVDIELAGGSDGSSDDDTSDLDDM